MPLRKEEKLLSNKRTEKNFLENNNWLFFVFKLFLQIELHFTSLSNFGLKTSKAKGKKIKIFPRGSFVDGAGSQVEMNLKHSAGNWLLDFLKQEDTFNRGPAFDLVSKQ